MFTDMEGYTALMQENEELAKQNRDRHRKIQQEATTRHGGACPGIENEKN